MRKLVIVSVFLLFAGCDLFAPDVAERDEYVVRMFLTVEEPLPPLILTTLPYIADEVPGEEIPQAQIVLEEVDESGDVIDSWLYERRNVFNEDTTQLVGTHGPNRELQELRPIRPLSTYRLHIELQGTGEQITATTTVPDTFRVARATSDELIFRGHEQLSLDLTPSAYPGRKAYYVISSASTRDELSREHLTPGAAELYPNVEDPEELELLRRGSSPVLNEAGYEITEEGFRRVRVPWISFRFFGPNEITVHALDNNLYDFLRTQQVQQSGSTLAPGETPNVIDHIDGATGIFGSQSEGRHAFELLRQNDDNE